MKYSILLFDLDGTLFDIHASQKQSFLNVMDKHFSFSATKKEKYYLVFASINIKMWGKVEREEIENIQVPPLRSAEFIKETQLPLSTQVFANEYLEELGKQTHLLSGARDILQKLSERGHTMHAVTNGVSHTQRERIVSTGIKKYFEKVFISDELGVGKPNPAYFKIVHEEIGRPDKEKVLLIGDSLHSDIRGGSDAGYATCFVNMEDIKNETEIRPTYEIKTLDELLNITK